MLKAFSVIGNAAYKTAFKSGIAAGTEQPPYPCASPLKSLETTTDTEPIEEILDAAYTGICDMLENMAILNSTLLHSSMQKNWKLLDFDDPNGDFSLYTRPHVGPYNFAKVIMTLKRVTPVMVFQSMHTQNFEVRKRYSCHLREYESFGHNPRIPEEMRKNDDVQLKEMAQRGLRNWYFEYSQMNAPQPVAARDLLFLIEKRYVAAEDAYYIYGCSVDYKPYAKRDSRCIRAIAMWGWKLVESNGNTVATYTSCMNPNGWAPTFLLDWMKSAIAKELTNARKLIYDARDRAELSRSNDKMLHTDTTTSYSEGTCSGGDNVDNASYKTKLNITDDDPRAVECKTIVYLESQHQKQDSMTITSSDTSLQIAMTDASDSSLKKMSSSDNDMDAESQEAEWINSISNSANHMSVEDERVLALDEELFVF